MKKSVWKVDFLFCGNFTDLRDKRCQTTQRLATFSQRRLSITFINGNASDLSNRRWFFCADHFNTIWTVCLIVCSVRISLLLSSNIQSNGTFINNQCHLFLSAIFLVTLKSHQNPETRFSSVISNMKRFHECFRLENVRQAWKITNVSWQKKKINIKIKATYIISKYWVSYTGLCRIFKMHNSYLYISQKVLSHVA